MSNRAACSPHSLSIVYADDNLVVVDKPSGLLSVPGRGADKQDCLSLRVTQQYPDALVVHRLDMATSGLFLMARGIKAQRRLSAAFAERQVQKTYVAQVSGHLSYAPEVWHEINLPIAVDWPNRPLRVIDHTLGQNSITRMRWAHYDAHKNITHVELSPVTGRSHQLRVHMLAIGHPILGDALYAPAAVQAQSPRLLLHAYSLSVLHPSGNGYLSFESSADFASIRNFTFA